MLFFFTPSEKTGKMEVTEKGERKNILIWLGTSMKKKCKGEKEEERMVGRTRQRKEEANH